MFSCEVFETFKNTYFIEHLRTAASGSCKHSIWTCCEIKDVDSTEFFRKIKLAPLGFNGFAQVFYVLFRSKHWTWLGDCSHYVLIAKSCAFFFFSCFSETRIQQNIIWALLPLFVTCETLNVQKTIEQEKQSSGSVL